MTPRSGSFEALNMGWGAGRVSLLCLLLAVWAADVRGKIAADHHLGR